LRWSACFHRRRCLPTASNGCCASRIRDVTPSVVPARDRRARPDA
jgi:hypothetical protein